jgi:tetratricopeptide (TPR) repeat protein
MKREEEKDSNRIGDLVKEGSYAAVVQEINKMPCPQRAELIQSPEGGYSFGLALLRLGLFSEVRRFLRARQKAGDSDAGTQKLECLVSLSKGRFSQAEIVLKKLLDEDAAQVLVDDAFLARVLIAGQAPILEPYLIGAQVPFKDFILALSSGNEDKIADLLVSVESESVSPPLLLVVAFQASQRQQFELALATIERALRIYPHHGDLLTYKLFLLRRLHKEKEFLESPEAAAIATWHHDFATQMLRARLKANQFAKSLSIPAKRMRPFMSLGSAADRAIECIKQQPGT